MELEVDGASGRFTGRVERHFEPEDKITWVEAQARSRGAGMEQVVAIGDGFSDLPLFSVAGFGVALNASSEAAAAASVGVASRSFLDALSAVPGLLVRRR